MEQFFEGAMAAIFGDGWARATILFLKDTALSQWVANSRWAWPVAESLHFVGLALLIGIIVPLDVRLMGFMKQVPIAALKRLVPWAVAGFLTCLGTGVIFFIGAPEQYITNLSFWLKVLFLVIAGANMAFFETTQRARVRALDPGADTPPVFKMIGAVSLAAWFMVLYWGRMLPFVGDAF